MQTIYEPKGAAREYAPLAVNLYRGCAHGCRYCYVPGIVRMSREEFHAKVEQKPGYLNALGRELVKREKKGTPKQRVHLCFTCDPFPEIDKPVVGDVLRMLRDYGYPVSVLTKAGERAMEYMDLLVSMDCEFGVSLCWESDNLRKQWEPGAGTVEGRLEALRRARELGIRTWASVEPVIMPAQALAAIDWLMPLADVIKVGRWNHDKEADEIDWKWFAGQVKHRLTGREYLLKKGLAELV